MTGKKKVAILKRDYYVERYNRKQCWFVTAWRLVDESGEDLVQPWMKSKEEAKKLAAALNYHLRDQG